VGGFGYPAMVALKPADLKYSTMRRWGLTYLILWCIFCFTACCCVGGFSASLRAAVWVALATLRLLLR
jgi:hypothetical protein